MTFDCNKSSFPVDGSECLDKLDDLGADGISDIGISWCMEKHHNG